MFFNEYMPLSQELHETGVTTASVYMLLEVAVQKRRAACAKLASLPVALPLRLNGL